MTNQETPLAKVLTAYWNMLVLNAATRYIIIPNITDEEALSLFEGVFDNTQLALKPQHNALLPFTTLGNASTKPRVGAELQALHLAFANTKIEFMGPKGIKRAFIKLPEHVETTEALSWIGLVHSVCGYPTTLEEQMDIASRPAPGIVATPFQHVCLHRNPDWAKPVVVNQCKEWVWIAKELIRNQLMPPSKLVTELQSWKMED